VEDGHGDDAIIARAAEHSPDGVRERRLRETDEMRGGHGHRGAEHRQHRAAEGRQPRALEGQAALAEPGREPDADAGCHPETERRARHHVVAARLAVRVQDLVVRFGASGSMPGCADG